MKKTNTITIRTHYSGDELILENLPKEVSTRFLAELLVSRLQPEGAIGQLAAALYERAARKTVDAVREKDTRWAITLLRLARISEFAAGQLEVAVSALSQFEEKEWAVFQATRAHEIPASSEEGSTRNSG